MLHKKKRPAIARMALSLLSGLFLLANMPVAYAAENNVPKPTEVLARTAESEVDIVAIKTPIKLSAAQQIVLYAAPNEKFTLELTAKFKTPVATKLAANLLLEKAKILSPERNQELSTNHTTTWHFDTESRPGYASPNGEGEISFPLIGYAPNTVGQFTFDLNLGLFDKKTWATKVLKIYRVNLWTDRAAFDQMISVAPTAPAAPASDAPKPAPKVNPEVQKLVNEQMEVRGGEIALEGIVDSIADTSALINAAQFYLPEKKFGVIKPAKKKTILVMDDTILQILGQAPLKKLHQIAPRGAVWRVVGKDEGSGKPLTARRITLLYFGG